MDLAASERLDSIARKNPISLLHGSTKRHPFSSKCTVVLLSMKCAFYPNPMHSRSSRQMPLNISGSHGSSITCLIETVSERARIVRHSVNGRIVYWISYNRFDIIFHTLVHGTIADAYGIISAQSSVPYYEVNFVSNCRWICCWLTPFHTPTVENNIDDRFSFQTSHYHSTTVHNSFVRQVT